MILHETHDEPTAALKRTLISMKVENDDQMATFHDFMQGGYDIITQFEMEHVYYVLLQKLETKPLAEALEDEKKAKKKK